LENAVWIRAGVSREQLAVVGEEVVASDVVLELGGCVSLAVLVVEGRTVELVDWTADGELLTELTAGVDAVELEPDEGSWLWLEATELDPGAEISELAAAQTTMTTMAATTAMEALVAVFLLTIIATLFPLKTALRSDLRVDTNLPIPTTPYSQASGIESATV